ncbi:hypothetical protein [Leptospira ellinghausenii]|nr:hypothetical protein [Leptospira ellinghausenii]
MERNVYYIYHLPYLVFYLIISIALYLNSTQYIPDYLNLRNKETISGLLLTIIGANASAIGLFISVFIISFSLINNSIRYFTIEYLTKNKSIIKLGYIFVISTLTSFFSYIFVINNYDFSLNFVYFSIILFILFIVSLIPLSLSILNNSISVDNIYKIINEINGNDVDQILNPLNSDSLESQTISFGRNNIFIVREFVVNAINSNDWMLPQFIIHATIDKIYNIFQPKINPFWNSGSKQAKLIEIFLQRILNIAIERKAYSTISACIRSIVFQLRKLYSEEILIDKYEDLFGYLKNIFNSIIKNEIQPNYSDVLQYYRTTVEDFINHKNIPPENEIHIFSFLYKSEFTKKTELNRNWEVFNESVLGIFPSIVKASIDIKDGELFKRSLWMISYIFQKIEESEVLSENQKDYLLANISTETIRLIKFSLESKLIKSISQYDFYSSIHIYNFIDKNKPYGKRLLYNYGNTFVEWSKNRWIEPFSLDNFFLIARMCISKVDQNKLSLESILYILKISESLRKYFAKEKMENHYLELYNGIKGIEYFAKENNIKTKKIYSKLNQLLNKFSQINRIKSKQTKNSISWN